MEFVAIAGLVVAIIGLSAVWIAWRQYRGAHEAVEFDKVCEYLKAHQPELRSLAWSGSPVAWKSTEIPLLVKDGWLLKTPKAPEAVTVKLAEPNVTPRDAQKRNRSSEILPGLQGSYSKALAARSGGEGLFNGVVYRPLRVEGSRGGLRITCTKGCYFDHLDNCEVLAYEIGARLVKGSKDPVAGPRRRAVIDPFDLSSRPTSLGINTLTIRKGVNGEHGFYMHRRSGSHVVNEVDQIGVVPAGEFTPSDISYEAVQADLSIWRNIMREYAEEFLGAPESYGRGGKTIDFENGEPYAELSAARNRGDLIVRIFGVAIEPLCFKPELLTVCIFTADTFDRIFANMVPENDEGTLLVGPDRCGIPFTSSNVKLYAQSQGTASAAAACLTLAWRHRKHLQLA
jgi:hypothetical protein